MELLVTVRFYDKEVRCKKREIEGKRCILCCVNIIKYKCACTKIFSAPKMKVREVMSHGVLLRQWSVMKKKRKERKCCILFCVNIIKHKYASRDKRASVKSILGMRPERFIKANQFSNSGV